MSASLILLHPHDNILIVVRPTRAGVALMIDGVQHHATQDIGTGHKVARTAMSAGTKICRYGAPIGSLTADVAAGEHVHLHNLKSDYIATHSRTTVSKGDQ